MNLAEAIWCLDEDKPKWQQCVIASAIATRLGLTTEGVDTEFELSKIPDSFQDKSYKALKEFFKNQQNLPPWFSQWKDAKAVEMKNKLSSKKAATENAAEEKENNETKTEADDGAATTAEAEKKDPGAVAATAADAATGLFKVNDIVIGTAGKSKDKYDEVECKIVKVLSHNYTCELLTGAAKGDIHKYLHSSVRAKAPPAEVSAATASAATASESATSGSSEASTTASEAGGDRGVQALTDIFVD